MQKHLKATDDVVSIQYTEIEPENWGDVYHQEIKPNLAKLAKNQIMKCNKHAS
ncbi:4-oxalocrotonate tautomerase [Actinobacillus equuli]|nr:4-oxalocrotonate tautomerase [Actinobacillus equuli]